MKKTAILASFFLISLSLNIPLFAQTIDQIQKSREDLDKEMQLRGRIEKQPEKPQIKEELPAPTAPLAGKAKTLIKDIRVTGVTLLPQKDIDAIAAQFKGKEVAAADMQKIAELITDAYRKNNYITSRAYLPPQKIAQGILEIRVLEGATGDIQVKGNRYFKTSLIRNKIALKNGQPFNYEELRKGLARINEIPDRNAKAVLAPGKEPGTTDVLLEVKDRLPIHIGLDYDNYGSRFVDKDRARVTLTHNNILGWDDVLTAQYQLAEGENYKLLTLRYVTPVNEDLKVGFFASDSKISLRQEFEEENLNARGKSRLYSLYFAQSLISKENASLTLNGGFDYKDSFNFQSGVEASRDRMRVAKLSLDADLTDSMGRTMFGNEFSQGFGGIMGGLEKVDSRASRAGSGGEFLKDNLYLLRLQRMPLESTLLWKNQAQITSDTLASTEQFQVGGIVNVRGYPAAEIVGDRGLSMTWELSNPLYFIPRQFKVPFSQAKLYDALRIVTFYDWAAAHLRNPGVTEEKTETLRSIGCGARLNLPENFSMRVEVAWPLDSTPSDGDHAHTWLELSKSF